MDKMIWIIYAVYAAFTGMYLFVHNGTNERTFVVWLLFCGLLAIPFYFKSRKNKPPSSAEKIVAASWLIIRRLVCFSASLLFGAVTLTVAHQIIIQKPSGEVYLVFAGSAILTAFCIWWGVFGTGESRSAFDDRPMHEERKKRYGWD